MLCLDAMGAGPKDLSTFSAAMECWPMMGTQKNGASKHVRGTISAPSKVTRRFESSWSGAVRALGGSGSHISSPEVSTCPMEYVNEEVFCAGAMGRFSINRCWTLS